MRGTCSLNHFNKGLYSFHLLVLWKGTKSSPEPLKSVSLAGTFAVFPRSAAWWRPALRCQRLTIQRFLIKNPGLVLTRRTPAPGSPPQQAPTRSRHSPASERRNFSCPNWTAGRDSARCGGIPLKLCPQLWTSTAASRLRTTRAKF